MMKKSLLLLAVVFAFVANAQQFEVTSLQEVKVDTEMPTFHPRFMPDGKTLMVCSENFNGLGLIDTQKGTYTHLTDMVAAGYYPAVSEDGNTIIVREKDYSDLSVDLYAIDLKSMTMSVIAEDYDHVNGVKFSNGTLTLSQHGIPVTKQVSKASYAIAASNNVYVTEEDLKVVAYVNGVRNVIDPFASEGRDENYCWSSLSPDGKKILFNCGNDAYVCNINGSGLVKLGSMRAPVWRGNDYVVAMVDEDDGYFFTKSDIVIVKADGSGRMQQLTKNSSEIKMYPAVSADGSKVAFHTLEGKVYLMTIKEK